MPRIKGSIYDLQDRTGLRASHIARVKNGRGVSLKNAVKLAVAMGMSLDQFVIEFYPHYHPASRRGNN